MEKEEISCLPLDIVLLHYWCLILYGFRTQNIYLKHSRKMLIFMDSNMFMTLFSILGGGRKWNSKNYHCASDNRLLHDHVCSYTTSITLHGTNFYVSTSHSTDISHISRGISATLHSTACATAAATTTTAATSTTIATTTTIAPTTTNATTTTAATTTSSFYIS